MKALLFVALAVLVIGGLMWNTFRMLQHTNHYLDKIDRTRLKPPEPDEAAEDDDDRA